MPAHNSMLASPAPAAAQAPMSGYPQTALASEEAVGGIVVDGTPMRVVTFAAAAAAGLYLLRRAGFKFNIATTTGA